MPFLLDSNFCFTLLRNKNSPGWKRLNAVLANEVLLSAVVEAELLTGAAKARDPIQATTEVQAFISNFVRLPFDSAAARVYAAIRAELESKGTPIGPNDFLIAATALHNQLTLITANTREFSRVPGLLVEDWTKP
jgi:tRNA(fMet)-specific endonuclease VapC